MTISADRLQDFFGRYAANLTNFDAEASARLWTEPGVIVDDRASMVAESRETMVEGLTMSYPLYRRLGLTSVNHELLDRTDVSEKLVLAKVLFRFFDAEGAQLTDTTSHYLLRDEASGLRATVCIETDAAEKIQQLAAARGVDLPR